MATFGYGPDPDTVQVNLTVERDRARDEADAATALADRLAHVLHAVDAWAGDRTARGPGADWERGVLRRVVAAAREAERLTDPYGELEVLREENARMREALRRVRDLDQSTVAEDDAYEERHDHWLGTCGGCDSIEIADAALVEHDPLAPEPAPAAAERPVTTLALPPTEDPR